jgi:polyisoprenoid-binding protein YceI
MNAQTKFKPTKFVLLVAILTILVVGIEACKPKIVRPSAATPAPGTVDTTGAVHYQVDSAASEVHILVYRGGAMARLGHNHVVSSKEVSGTLLLNNDLARSSLELTLPVTTLTVDDPQARKTEGADFTAEVPQEAREGTRRNMQRPELLDGEHYPTIKLQSVAFAGSRSNPSLIMRTTIKGVARDVVVLATVKEEGRRISAEGEFTIQQTDFGIAPFSAALGALQVQDRLRIRFSLVCRQQQ